MGSRGKGGEKVSWRPVDASNCAHRTQLVFAPLFMREMAAKLVSKVRYFSHEFSVDK
jgi:hypothetical protein